MTDPFDFDGVLSAAQAVDGLDDFGDDDRWREPLGVLLDAYATAPLTDLGRHILRSGVVHSLAMRLRAGEWERRHPEIHAETIAAPIVVVGMMRSGTTLVQRLLAADRRLHAALGWEVGEVAPRLDRDPTDAQLVGPDPRIAAAEEREEQSRIFVPDLFAIHPMYAHEAEEEIMFLADAFLSHVPEASADVPAYRRWIDTQPFAPAYAHLRRMLQLLQWQKRAGGAAAERWVLKTPAHLGYLDTLVDTFPDVHVVHLHRDPVDTIPSGASLNTTLWRMHVDDVDPTRVGMQWIERMGWTNDRAMRSRASWGDSGRVTDLRFDDVVRDPVAAMEKVYDDVNLTLTAEAVDAMTTWRDRHAARRVPTHRYRARDFGLTEDQIRERFSEYVERYLAN